MDELIKKINAPVDYNAFSFEDMDVNPYEMVIAASKFARDVNDKARKICGAETDIYPRNIAVQKLVSKDFALVYEDEPKPAAEDFPVEES